ncbi:MAG TPA: amidohydrolase family protein, partial [Chloroflexota bacterium]
YLQQITPRADTEVALNRSYNRWLADIWRQGEGRLRWIYMPPLLRINEAVDQLSWAAENGACGVMMRGLEGDRMLINPYFFPLYEEAQRLNLPICIHAGGGNPQYRLVVETEGFSRAKLLVVGSMHALLSHDIPSKFPELRWGFIEASASWLPWLLSDLGRRRERDGHPIDKRTILPENRMYVTCQTDDDLPYLVDTVGEDSLVIGTDYGHADTSSEIDALRKLHVSGVVPPGVVHKILEDNPKALYGI